MADKEIKIRFTVDDNGVVQKIDGIEDAVKKTGKTAEESASGFTRFEAKLVSLSAALDLGQRAFSAIQSVISTTFDVLDRAGQVENLTRSFENLQDSIGNNATDKLKALQDATRGLVSDQELLQQANQAVLLGVDDGSGKFEQLAAAALKLGQAQGITAAQAIESLTVGIGRQSKQVLDNLGVIVEAEKAYEAYANRIGVASEKLTDQQRRIAFNEAATISITEKAQNLADAQESAAFQSQGLSAQFQNLIDRFATAFSKNEDLNLSIQTLATRLKDVDVETLASDMASAASATINFVGALTKLIEATAPSNIKKNLELIGDGILLYGQKLVYWEKAQTELAQQLVAGLKVFKPTQENLEKLTKLYVKLTEKVNAQGYSIGNEQNALKNLGIELGKFAIATEEASKAQEDMTEVMVRGVPKIEDTEQELSDLSKTIEGLTQDRFDGSLAALEESVEDAYIAFAQTGDLETFKEDLSFIGVTAGEVTDGIETVENAIKALPTAFRDSIPEIQKYFDELKKDTKEGFGDVFLEGIAADFGNIFNVALTGDSEQVAAALGETIGGALGAAAGSFLGPAGTAIGATIGSALGSLIGGAFEDNTNAESNAREGFFEFIRAAIGKNEALVFVKGEFETVAEAFSDLARDIFDEFYKIEPGGGGITSAGVPIFNELFAQSDEVRTAFFGVGEAVAQLFDDVNLDGAQVAALLNQKLGGSLQNLQVLVMSLGFSFEELSDVMIEAAKNGEISFLEAESALRSIGQLAEKGIPGQIGAVTEAFNNLKEAGEQGGLFTIDALRDIGAEAAEVGATSLADLREALEDAGVSADDLNKFFESLAEVGIGSVQELADVTDRQAIQVLADLETLAFGFLETTNQAADDLISRLENIPAEIESRIVIDVETRARDQGAQQVIDSGTLGLTL